MTVILKYCDGVHVYDDMASAIAKQDEIGGELFVPVDTIATLTAERDRLLDAAINARAELSNHDRYEYGGVNREVVDCIAELDAAIAQTRKGAAQ